VTIAGRFMDDTQDNQDGRWLTYAELATIRGIGRASAVKLVQRERWRRSSGNDRSRIVRVLVPTDWLAPAKEKPAETSGFPATSGEDTGMMAGALAVLEDAVASLREQLDVANSRGERADARSDALRAELDAAKGDLSFVKAVLDRTQAEAKAARERAEALQRDDDARKARGLLARLRAAVRGE
jgi:hypothetical protein